jgi:hypothetical protein
MGGGWLRGVRMVDCTCGTYKEALVVVGVEEEE